MKKFIPSFILLLGSLFWMQIQAQVITTIPTLPVADDTVTIIYDAALGNGALAGFSGDVYAHTGVITDKSTSPSDWKYVKSNWGTTDPSVRMTSLGNDKYQLKYHLRNYYGVPMADTIKQMAFVFRDGAGNTVGRAADGSDMFVNVAQPGLGLVFLNPSSPQNIVDQGGSLNILVGASNADTLRLLIDQVEVAKTANASLSYSFTGNTVGFYRITAVAEGNGDTVTDSTGLYVRDPNPPVAALPPGVRDGINYINDTTVILSLYAPLKNYVFVIGDFNNWEVSGLNYMNRTPDGNHYWKEITNLTPAQEYAYQYWVDGDLRIADPFTEKILDPWADKDISATTYPDLKPYPTGKTSRIVSVFQTAQQPYVWQTNNFQKPSNTDLLVYELHIRDFIAAHDFKTVIDTLDYIQNLGFNAIELMPIQEFENNDSWGYNPSFFFAVDKYYGPADDLKALIDACHARGIAVIGDVVLNHAFGQNPWVELWWDDAQNRPAANSPFFNPVPKHDFNVGYDFNHESQATQDFMYRFVKHWLSEYRFDGYRFDLSKGFTQKNTLGNVGAWGQFDQWRVDYLKSIADTMWGVDPNAYVILEHLADNSEERDLGNYGLMLWGNAHFDYKDAAIGYTPGDFNWISYKRRGWNEPHVVGYMESHDEQRLMYEAKMYGNSSGSYNIKDIETGLSRMELAATFFFTVPGPKMIWQFGELGYDIDINQNGRTGRKPIRWNYFSEPARKRLYQVYSALADLKVNEPAFESDDFSLDVRGDLKRILVNHTDMDVCVIGNFGVTTGSIIPNFQQTGMWYEFFTGDSLNVTNTSLNISLAAGEYRLYTTKRLTKPNLINVGLSPEKVFDGTFGAYPNPTNGWMNLEVSLQSSSAVKLSLMDYQGKVIATRQLGQQAAGEHSFQWNLQNESIAAGLYIIRLQAGTREVSQKIIFK